MAYTKDQYLKMIEKFNSLTFSEQIDLIKEKSEVFNFSLDISFREIPAHIEGELLDEGKSLKLNYND